MNIKTSVIVLAVIAVIFFLPNAMLGNMLVPIELPLVDNFNDNNLLHDPAWTIDSGDFYVENGVLKGRGQASIPILHSTGTWEFVIHVPDNSQNGIWNYWLFRDDDNQGYYIEFNILNGRYFISVNKQDNDGRSSVREIISDAPLNIDPGKITKFRVTRDAEGNFKLYHKNHFYGQGKDYSNIIPKKLVITTYSKQGFELDEIRAYPDVVAP